MNKEQTIKYHAKKRFFLLIVAALAVVSLNNSFGQTGLGIRKVVIDPGHGGKDPGAIGVDKLYEKDVALDVSLQLGNLIKKNFPEVEVVYTRSTDVFIGLAERARVANRIGADLFISLHANAAANTKAHGAETWVLGLHKSAAALEIAKKENSSILMEDDHDQTYESFDPNDPDAYIALSMRQNAFLNQSLMFADLIQKNVVGDLGRNQRGVKQAGFMVLYRTTMPSVLVELGFLSNKEECAFLRSKSGRSSMAKEIYDAFAAYKKLSDKVDDELEGESTEQDVEEPMKFEPKEESKEVAKVENGVVFKVQIATSSNKLPLKPENFKGNRDVEMYQSGKMYKYTAGRYKTFDEAQTRMYGLRKNGYDSSFVVAFENGERIDINKAKQKTGK